MKRRLKYFLIVCLAVLALFSIGYSRNSVLADESTHTVTFSYNLARVRKYIVDENDMILGDIKTVTQTVSHGNVATRPTLSNTSVLVYYTYDWTVDGEVVNVETYPITEDTEFIAKWTPVEFRVNFKYGDFKDSVVDRVDSIPYNIESSRITLYRPQVPNYIFRGWYDTPNDEGTIETLYISPRSTGNRTLYAKFSPVNYYIDYHTSGTHYNPTGYNVEDEDIILGEPTLYGHIFKGWFADENFKNPITSIDCSKGGNIDVFPMWELETYKVTYILPSGLTKTVEVEYGGTADLPKLDKSIFEIVKTDASRKNITEDTTIRLQYVNIWYVYVIILVVVGGMVTLIICLKKRRENTHNNLRAMYYSNIKGKRK